MSSGAFADAMSQNRELMTFFFSPYFSVTEKKEGLERAVTGASPAFANFLQALIERHRMPAIFRIRTEFNMLWDEARKLLPVQITSAIALDEDEVKSLGERIGKQVDRQVRGVRRCRSRHPRRGSAESGERHPRRLDQEPSGTTSKASGAGVGPRL